MSELSKCPCCGSDAVYSYYTKAQDNGESEKYSVFVVCSQCGLRTKSIVRDVSYSAEQLVASSWNRRV